MPLKCSVIGCHSNYDKERFHGAQTYSVFSFPTNNPELLKQWITILGFSEDYVPRKTARVCQKHFFRSSYVKRGTQNHLIPNSLPIHSEPENYATEKLPVKRSHRNKTIVKQESSKFSEHQEEVLEVSEDAIVNFENFQLSMYNNLNLTDWSTFKTSKEDNLICIYQLIEEKNPTDIKFHCKVIIENNLQVRVMSNDADGAYLVETFQLNYWWQLEQILQKYSQFYFEEVEVIQNIEENTTGEMDEIKVETIEELDSLNGSCKEVGEEFLEENIIEEIYLESIYTCEICDVVLSTELKYKKHLLTHNADNQFIAPQKCPTCEKTFDEQKKLKRHQMICQVERKFLCDICCMRFKNKTSLNAHLMRHNDANKTPCIVCGLRFFPGQDMANHLYRHQNLKPHKCHLCEKSYGKSDALKVHLESHSSIKPKCPHCFKECRNSAMLKWHIKNNKCVLTKAFNLKKEKNGLKKKKVSNYRPFPCFAGECSKKFITKQLLWNHLKEYHGLEIKNFERYCVYCQVELESNNTYMIHVRGHFCNFQCKTCGRKFKAESILKEHEKVHENGESRPFACDICNLNFKSDSNLKSHKIIQHSTATPYACNECDNAYKFKNLLDRHIRTFHERNCDQKCRICEVSFNSHSTLTNHMINAHETDQMYACNLCDVTFKYLNDLKQHKHDFHGDKFCRQTTKKLDALDEREIQSIEVSYNEEDLLVEEDLQ